MSAPSRLSPAPLYVGIDAGGSKTEVLAHAGEASVTRIGPGVNLQRDGAERSAGVLAALIEDTLNALEHHGIGGICAGVAGAGRLTERDALAGRVRARLGPVLRGRPLWIEHDALIALEAAFEGESGMVVVVGTGSVVLARTGDGALLRAGGWGPRIGDEGSGTAIGTAALGVVAADFDGGEPTALRRRLAETYGLETPDDLIHRVYAGGWNVQELAPLVVATAEAGDWACIRLLETQANALAQQAGRLATRAQDAVSPRVALLGGLAEAASYRGCLTGALRRHLPGWHVARPVRHPVHGALALAQRCATAAAHEIDSGG